MWHIGRVTRNTLLCTTDARCCRAVLLRYNGRRASSRHREFIDSAILVAANGIRPVLPVAAFTLGYTALVIGLVFAVAQAVRYIQVLLPTTGAWIAVVVPCSLYAFWRPGRRGISFWLWLVYLGIVLPIVPCGGAAVALVPPYFDSSVPRRHLPVYAGIVVVVVLLQSLELL